MRSGGMYHRIKFFAKQVTRDAYGASSDSWNYLLPTITTRGDIRYTGGGYAIANEEKFYSKSVELLIRFRTDIEETMRVQIDGTNDLWAINYKEEIGRQEGLRLTIEKLPDGLSGVIVEKPTGFTALLDAEVKIDLAWTNNTNDDAVSIERSKDGNLFAEIHRTAKEVESYSDEELEEETRYYYRIRHFSYRYYSEYTGVEVETTETII
jgi:head-tail adaptor